jgi:hypothetical protein
VTLLLGLFPAPYLHYQDTLVAFLPGVLGHDFARSRRPKLLRVFRVLILVAMFRAGGSIRHALQPPAWLGLASATHNDFGGGVRPRAAAAEA